MLQRSVTLGAAILVLTTLLLCGVVCAETQTPAQIRKALQIRAPNPDDYAYVSRDITGIPVDNSVIEFQAAVKFLRFQSTPAGVPLQIDLRGYSGSAKTQELRYSFRFGNDGSIIFFYPFMNSSAAVTKQKAWVLGKWHHLRTVVSGSSAKFYINGTQVGENSLEHPATSSGFVLSHIGFGKTERQKPSFEALVTDIEVVQNGTIKVSEEFSSDLTAYEIKRSEKALLQLIDPSRYASLEAYVKPTIASTGDVIHLYANLLDSSLNALPNRAVAFEYRSGNEWQGITGAVTSDNGTAKASWRIPPNLGTLLIRAHFAGDEQFSEASSEPANVVVLARASERFEVANLVLPIYGLALLAMVISASRFGYSRVLSCLIPALCSLVFVLSLFILTNSIEIKAVIGYTPRTVSLHLLGAEIDRTLWILLAVTLVGSWAALQNRILLSHRETLIPAFALLASLGLSLSGREFTGALLGIVSALVTVFFPIMFIDQQKTQSPLEPALRFIASLLVIVSAVEIGSAAGWLYNVIDPHVPFDGEPRWIIASLETNMFGLLYPTTLAMLVILMFAWIWVPLMEISAEPLLSKLRPLMAGSQKSVSSNPDLPQRELGQPLGKKGRRTAPRYRSILWLLTIAAILVCAIFLVYYPYIYTTRLIGVDTPWYYQNLLEMSKSGGVSRLISSYSTASRIPYLLLLYILMSLTSFPPDLVVKIGPAVPAAFMGLTTLLLIRTLTHSDLLAVFSAFLGLFSVATTVGVYAGIFSNWLALGWTALFLGLLLRLWRHPSRLQVLAATLVSFVVLATHAWTWAIVLASLVLSSVLSPLLLLPARRHILQDSALRAGLIIVGSNIALLLLIASLLPTGEFMHMSREVITYVNMDNLQTFPASFAFTVQYYVGGFIANPVIILLAIIGLAASRRFDKRLSLLLLSMLIITSIPLLLLGSFWQWRLLYVIPYQVLAVIGTAWMSQKIAAADSRFATLCQSLLMVTILLSSFNYALRSLNYIPS